MTQLSSELLAPYIGSNVVSILLSVVAALLPRASRWIFVLMFLGAGIVNIITAIQQPRLYITFGEFALPEIYRSFIYGLFSQYTQPIVIAIAIGQLLVGVLLIARARGELFSLGVLGGMIFLIAITPLGVGSAFPAPLIMAAALFVTWNRLLEVHRHTVEGQ